MVRFYVEMLAALGPPQPAVRADSPYGPAFGPAGEPKLVPRLITARSRTGFSEV
jgi:endo-1,3(4)-beta-glucanase